MKKQISGKSYYTNGKVVSKSFKSKKEAQKFKVAKQKANDVKMVILQNAY